MSKAQRIRRWRELPAWLRWGYAAFYFGTVFAVLLYTFWPIRG